MVLEDVDERVLFTAPSIIVRGNESWPFTKQRQEYSYYTKEGERRGVVNAGSCR
jgi:hypothetical protein